MGKSGVSGGGISQHILRAFESLRNPVYRFYYVSMVCQWSAINMDMVARSLLLYRLTGSGAILGGMALANAIPTILLSLLGGAIADRVQKKYVLLVGQSTAVIVSLGIAVALSTGYLSTEHSGSWWVLIACSALQGGIVGIVMPSRQAIIPEIVSEQQVMNAVSLNILGQNTFRLLAPAVTGVLIDTVDFDVVYYIMTGIYFLGTILVVFMPTTSTINLRRSSTLTDVLEGVRYIRQQTTILLIIILTLTGIILTMPFMQLLPMFTEDILKVSATNMGLLLTISGLGAILASLALAYLPKKKQGLILLVSSLIVSLALVFFSFSHWWHLSLVLIFFIGVGMSGHQTASISLVQYYTEAKYRGRMMSFLMMGLGFAGLGSFFAGILAQAVGVQWSVGGLAMLFVLISILIFTLTPRLRKLD